MMLPVRTDTYGTGDVGLISQSVIDYEADEIQRLSVRVKSRFRIGNKFETPKRYTHRHHVYKVHDDKRINGFYAYQTDGNQFFLDYLVRRQDQQYQYDELIKDFLKRVSHNHAINTVKVTVKPEQVSWLAEFDFRQLGATDSVILCKELNRQAQLL